MIIIIKSTSSDIAVRLQKLYPSSCSLFVQVNELLGSWYETLLECETSSDGSVDMYNRQKDQTLRAVLINSGLVQGTGNLQNNAPTTTTPNHNNSAVSSDTER